MLSRFTVSWYYLTNWLGRLKSPQPVGRSWDRFPVVSLGIFSVVPPTEPCALRSTQPLKMSTRDFSCVWLTTYHPC